MATVDYSQVLVEAEFVCKYVELTDADPTTKTLQLAPVFMFGASAIKVLAVKENTDADLYPELASAKMRMNAVIYTNMIRYQQGSEVAGEEPPPWALVEDSAVEVETKRVLETGEVYPIFG